MIDSVGFAIERTYSIQASVAGHISQTRNSQRLHPAQGLRVCAGGKGLGVCKCESKVDPCLLQGEKLPLLSLDSHARSRSIKLRHDSVLSMDCGIAKHSVDKLCSEREA